MSMAVSPTPVDVGLNPLDLRGLGPEETLLLINGERIGPAAGQVAQRGEGDVLRAIPTAQVDRIEIYPATVSARYGAAAQPQAL